MTSASTHTAMAANTTHVINGAVGGLAGGLIFGALMQMMGMIGMIAQLVGGSATAVGWIVHLAISVFIGATFGLLVGTRGSGLGVAAVLGLSYGVVWWVLGGLIILPARLGMGVFMFNETAWRSLMGHLVYGPVLGLVFAALTRRHRH